MPAFNAEELFTDAFGRYMKNWTVIVSLRQFVGAAAPYAATILAAQHSALTNFVADDPEYSKVLSGGGPISPEFRGTIQVAITDGVMSSAHAAIDAASIVFAQSILDDSAWSYLRVCALMEPTAWEGLTDAKKIDAKTVREKNYEGIRAELIQGKLDQLGRESLLTKIDLLFKLCTPPNNYSPMNNYAYDRERIERIDGERHRMIHENGFIKPLATVEQDLDYISKTAWFLMGLVNHKYGVQLDTTRLGRHQQATTPQSSS